MTDKGRAEMKIELIGDCCAKCRLLEKNLNEAIAQTGIGAELLKGADPARVAHYGLLTLPGLAIDGNLVARGKVLTVDEIAQLLKES